MMNGHVVGVPKANYIVSAFWVATIIKLDGIDFVIRINYDIFKFLLLYRIAIGQH